MSSKESKKQSKFYIKWGALLILLLIIASAFFLIWHSKTSKKIIIVWGEKFRCETLSERDRQDIINWEKLNQFATQINKESVASVEAHILDCGTKREHDDSNLSPELKAIFDKYQPALDNLTYTRKEFEIQVALCRNSWREVKDEENVQKIGWIDLNNIAIRKILYRNHCILQ